MRIDDNKFLDRYRKPGLCELCGKPCWKREPHHVIAKGMGGGRQLDCRFNIISLGSSPAFQCQCHDRIDRAGGRERCWSVIAIREQTSPEIIKEVCFWILNLDHHASRAKIFDRMMDLSLLGMVHAAAILHEHRKI